MVELANRNTEYHRTFYASPYILFPANVTSTTNSRDTCNNHLQSEGCVRNEEKHCERKKNNKEKNNKEIWGKMNLEKKECLLCCKSKRYGKRTGKNVFISHVQTPRAPRPSVTSAVGNFNAISLPKHVF